MSVAVRAYVRRTHLGHGQSLRKPGAYSFVESVIDRALFKTLREYFLSEYLRGLPADDEEVYRAREAKSLREASELACRLARESGVGCIVVEDERNGLPRPVFYHGNAVYVTGYFGSPFLSSSTTMQPTPDSLAKRHASSEASRRLFASLAL